MTDDLIGRKFGRLTVIDIAPRKGQYIMWRCLCECGSEVVTRGSYLKNGHTSSCGCYQRQAVTDANTKHGLYQHRLYRIYRHMIGRCYNQKETGYENYGGRGISVCATWKNDFKQFAEWAMLNGYSDALTLDRIDVDGDYTPENCRWVTSKKQANNMRSNHILRYNGEEHTISEWAEIIGMPYQRLLSRIFRGWSVEDALTRPYMKRRSKSSVAPAEI